MTGDIMMMTYKYTKGTVVFHTLFIFLHFYSNFLHSSWIDSFIVSMIEKGRRLYGVGTHCQMCVLFDRGGKVTVNGLPKREKADMKIVPKLLDLVSNLRVTLQVISEFDARQLRV